MNAIVNRTAGSAVASLQGLKAGLQNVQSTIKASGGDPFLRLQKNGKWVFGKENLEVMEGSLWAINPLSIMHGWASWTDKPGKEKNELVGEMMVALTSPLPVENTLRDTQWPWDQQLSFILMCVGPEGDEDVGKQVLYKTTSHGGKTAAKELIGKITAQLDKGTQIVPVIALESDSYKHDKWGDTATPIFNVQKWVELTDDLPAELAAEETDETQVEETVVEQPVEQAKAARAPRKPTERKVTPASPERTVSENDAKAAQLEALQAEIARLTGTAGQAPVETPEPETAQAAAPGTTIRRQRR